MKEKSSSIEALKVTHEMYKTVPTFDLKLKILIVALVEIAAGEYFIHGDSETASEPGYQKFAAVMNCRGFLLSILPEAKAREMLSNMETIFTTTK